jgi:Outer membrane protein beta-barrel domain
MNSSMNRRVLAVMVTCAAAMIPSARAQDVPSVRKGTLEIGGFVGSSYGFDKLRIMGGGNVSYGVLRWLLPYVEVSYFPGLGRQFENTLGIVHQNVSYTVPTTDFNGGAHLRVPIRESKVVPYGVVGMGLMHSNFKGNANVTVQNNPPTLQPFAISETVAVVNFGGGLRYYTTEKFGFRLEAKAYHPLSGNFSNFVGKFEVGFFYQAR